MRILLVSNQFFPVMGGIENLLRDYVPALRSRGHDVAVLTGRHRSARDQLDAYEGIPVFRSDLERSRANSDARDVHRSRRWIESIEREWAPDVVHAHDVGPNLWAHLRIADRAPTLTTIHASLPALLDPGSVPVALRLLEACEWVSCVSRVALEEVRALAPAISDRSSFVPNGVIVPTEPPVAPPREPRVLCLGRLVAQKGFDVAVAAMPEVIDRVPGATLDIAGDGFERPKLERLVDDLGLRASVHFHGVLRHSEVGACLDATHVLAMPSRFEGLPLVWLEAALRARPAVATATHGLGEVIEHRRTGMLVPPDDAPALASGLATVLESAELAGALGMAARDQVIQGYSMDACLDAYTELYHRIMGRARSLGKPVASQVVTSIRILDGHVAHERLDDEVVVINLHTGAYYALDGASADCWTLLAHRTPLSETANVLADRHAVDRGAIGIEVDALAAELVREGLAAWDPDGPGSAEPSSLLPECPGERAGAATRLRVEKYDDMEELLLLDPIHEVDASGWPRSPPSPPEEHTSKHDARDFVRAALVAFDRACAGASRSVARSYRVADAMIDVRYAGEALPRRFDVALAPFTEPAQPDPGLTISCWDRSSVDVTPPSPPWALDDLLPRGRVRGFDGHVRATYDAHFGILNLYDADSRQAVYFAQDAGRIPPWIERAPFRALLGWWATDRELAVVHASAVGSSDGCVLITGPSGSGKSTTALACVVGGFEVVCDDLAIVALEPEPTAFATTAVAKLEATSRVPIDRLGDGVLKTVGDQMMLGLGDRLLPSAPVRAVIGAAIGSGSRTSALPMTPGACFRALAGHSVVEALAGDRRPLLALRELARRVPAYAVTLGRDLDGVVTTVRAILEGAA